MYACSTKSLLSSGRYSRTLERKVSASGAIELVAIVLYHKLEKCYSSRVVSVFLVESCLVRHKAGSLQPREPRIFYRHMEGMQRV